ncbi:MAG: hypothetical protein F4Y07_02450 [Gemmatimonadetes bacterium]|nr:hypothetical protein [Gemmatimonadota bacterium]MYE15318.1 hypothetical protein [Gemmatimonadota bacterium]MYG21243.1 hypothetical protein [Gemmatimonadota bacterium]MYJ38054.1 hypothetical protein [Gemmatimonadota bacterium]
MSRGVRVARWMAGVIMIAYGFAKLTGSQFTVLDSELTRPMGEVSGFWLTWYYFGFSSVYRTIIALVEIGGGLLLIWPRTSLIGALVLLPVVGNIILTDILFLVGALPASVTVLICLMIILRPHAQRLADAVLLDIKSSRRGVTLRAAAVVAVLVGAWGLGYWFANYNNREPTPIDGVWTVEDGGAPLEQVFFEYNRAYMAVFRFADGDAVHHFEVDSGRVRVWADWMEKGRLIYEGEIVDPGRIELRPSGGGSPVVLVKE